MILDKENSLYAKCIQVFLITMIVVFEPEGLFGKMPSITDGVHRIENFVEIIPVFSTFSNFFKKKRKKKKL